MLLRVQPAVRPAITASFTPIVSPIGSVSPRPSTFAFSRSDTDTFIMATRMIAPTQIDSTV